MSRNSILGQEIKWWVVEYTHSRQDAVTGEWCDRYRVETVTAIRSGVVWSAGPTPGTAWVIPDEREYGEGYAVCVHINKAGMHRARPMDVERSTEAAQRMALAERDYCRRGIGDKRGAAPVNV